MAAVSPSTPTGWTNQRLVLYHGTLDAQVSSILGGINLRAGRFNTDFGQGFYTTTVRRQALSWAWQLSQRRPRTQPVVISFDVDRDALAGLECLWFVRGSFDADDFWSLIMHCRGGGTGHVRGGANRWYDIVIGPVAASWRQRLAIYDADQVSFHTTRAVNLLNNSQPKRIA